MCANPFRVGDACLALADRLSEKVRHYDNPRKAMAAFEPCEPWPAWGNVCHTQLAKKSPEHDTDRILNFIRELLQHAKANFSKATEPRYGWACIASYAPT